MALAGSDLKALRVAAGLNQAELGAIVGCSQALISGLESLDTVYKLPFDPFSVPELRRAWLGLLSRVSTFFCEVENAKNHDF